MTKLKLTYEFDSEEELRAHLEGATRSDTAPQALAPATPVTSEAPTDDNGPTADDVDGDGMKYDDDIHANPPQFTADGLWRAKRGKADEAKAAREKFKAGGGTEAPASAPTGMPGMPGAPAASALGEDMPEPVTQERLFEKISGMLGREKIAQDQVTALYAKHSGGADPAQYFNIFSTNESARAALFAELCVTEPEMA